MFASGRPTGALLLASAVASFTIFAVHWQQVEERQVRLYCGRAGGLVGQHDGAEPLLLVPQRMKDGLKKDELLYNTKLKELGFSTEDVASPETAGSKQSLVQTTPSLMKS